MFSLLVLSLVIAGLAIVGLVIILYFLRKKMLAYDINPDEFSHLQERLVYLEKDLKQKTSEATQTNKELYLANIQLNQEKDKANAIIKYMADGIIVIDNDGRIIEINDLAVNLFDLPEKNSLAAPIRDVISNSAYLDALERIQNQQQHANELDISLIKPDKTWRTLNIKTSRASDKKGNPLGIISLIRDVTKQKELDNLKNNFIRTISHELRTPLTSIIGFIDILKSEKRGPLNNDQKEFLDVIHKGSFHLRQLINDLLDISLIESKKLQLKFENINTCTLFKNVTENFMPQIKLKGIRCIFEDAPDLPNVYTDKDKAKRIYTNILNNAIKFTNQGHVKIYFSSNDKFVNIHIEDTGIGISPEEKAIIFERFRQIDASSTRKYEGMGIGLTIVKDLINLLGGSINVVSEQDQGSTFSFSLPINSGQIREYES